MLALSKLCVDNIWILMPVVDVDPYLNFVATLYILATLKYQTKKKEKDKR
jgi:hypothetical protein